MVSQVREEDKSSYVAEWASKHAFGPPSPQADDHHGEHCEGEEEGGFDQLNPIFFKLVVC